ncbi:MAG: ABC transporter permease, partial [Anaerolineae bacterium]|nr:ABC transporter permease [Anaerolineae bacterium]
TIVTYKQQRARSLRAPWWQRVWMDLWLFIPAIYGWYTLREQGSLLVTTASSGSVNDPFQNPLLFLVPALLIFSLTLFILRLLPAVMSLIASLTARLPGVGALLAARHLSRSTSSYAAPLMLLVLTLSLSAFTASLAQTMDNNLIDQTYYRTGADLRIVESAESTSSEYTENESTGAAYYFLPVAEHLQVAGVQAAARVGRYRAFASISSGRESGTILGIDRVDFGSVAFWRSDFAPVSLGSMMNALAGTYNGVLVPYSFLREQSLTLHDLIRISIDIGGSRMPVDFEIVGVFDMFPTWYPNDENSGPLFVGNLDYIFQEVGGQFPYNVWLRIDPEIPSQQIIDGVQDQGLRVQTWQDSVTFITEELQRPQRQGLFGLLSVGFIAAALLTVLGFMLYAFFSFRRRFIELGVLRAVGLSARQMTSFLGWELVFLMSVGLAAGTGLGIMVSNMFIPYLQVGTASSQIPPFVVQISWPAVFQIYILFGVLFIAALGALVWLLMRMKIFQAIKLGETG